VREGASLEGEFSTCPGHKRKFSPFLQPCVPPAVGVPNALVPGGIDILVDMPMGTYWMAWDCYMLMLIK
jgi:hypothetical protein